MTGCQHLLIKESAWRGQFLMCGQALPLGWADMDHDEHGWIRYTRSGWNTLGDGRIGSWPLVSARSAVRVTSPKNAACSAARRPVTSSAAPAATSGPSPGGRRE